MTPNFDSPYAPLPGTERAVRALFIDRWGTLLDLPAKGSSVRFSPERVLPGAVDALFRAQQAGWSIYLIGNEEAVAEGRWSDAAWGRFEAEMLAHLRSLGVRVVRCYACLDHPEGAGDHQKPSVFLLPDTGLLYHAAQMDGVELRESWVIGDSTLELAAGGRAGCRTIGVRTGLSFADGGMEVEPDVVAGDLVEALDLLIQAATRV